MPKKINSKRKGKVGELSWAKFCRDQGYECRRTAQYCGKTGEASDVIGLPGIHQEVKRVERLDLYGALSQAKRDARPGEIPIVAHRRNNHDWVVIMDAEDWFELYRVWEADMALRKAQEEKKSMEEAAWREAVENRVEGEEDEDCT